MIDQGQNGYCDDQQRSAPGALLFALCPLLFALAS